MQVHPVAWGDREDPVFSDSEFAWSDLFDVEQGWGMIGKAKKRKKVKKEKKKREKREKKRKKRNKRVKREKKLKKVKKARKSGKNGEKTVETPLFTHFKNTQPCCSKTTKLESCLFYPVLL